MVFSSLSFLCIFLPVVFGLSFILPGVRAKNVLLVIASLLFYAYGEPIYVLLMIGSSFVNYLAGLLLGISAARSEEEAAALQDGQGAEGRGAGVKHGNRPPRSGGAKLVVALAVIVNLGVLILFKYADMLVGAINAILPIGIPEPHLALPLGISFFTFQAMSYVIDVYRGEVRAQSNYLHVLLYISLFPQLIAGPIVKYHDIQDQILNRKRTPAAVAQGLRRFCFGLAKKVLIANNLAVAVDMLFAVDSAELNVIAAWTAAIAYMLQIYFDFSGYSDMAIGLGRMFGFTFKENFNYPYVSTTIQGFWRRWHISLSTWFKEYLYIPMGGNRRGKARTNFNKFTVFFLCGLWHGAAWTFVVWGLIHGAFIMFENIVPMKRLPKPIGYIYTMLVVCLAFVIFRADTFPQAWGLLSSMFTGWDFGHAQMVVALEPLTPKFIGALVIGLVAALPIKGAIENWLAERGGGVMATAQALSFLLAIVLLAVCMLELSSGAYNPFIYFRF